MSPEMSAYAQQLDLASKITTGEMWWPGAGSNRRPTAFQAVARTN
jgi:hypothetical protein